MLTVLVIEDELIEQITLKALLRSLGYSTISCVSSLRDANKLINEQRPDLIIADIFLRDEMAIQLFDTLTEPYIPLVSKRHQCLQ